MAALTAPRTRTDRLGDAAVPPLLKLPVAGGVTIYAGAMIAVGSGNGLAVPATAGVGLKMVGRAEKTVDNATGADGDKVVTVRRGVFKWANSAAGDLISQANVGMVCYAVDDQTVAATDGGGARSPAGVVLQVESDGVFVETGVDLLLAEKLA